MSSNPVVKLVILFFLAVTVPAAQLDAGEELPPIEWRDCPADFSAQGYLCTTVDVLENRAQPEGRKIPIFVARRLAGDSPVSPPLVLLSGGPGIAATAQAPIIDRMLGNAGQQRDVVLMDIRGSGGSNALRCQPPGPPDHLQSYMIDLWPQAHRDECWRQLGEVADLRYYTIPEAMADLEEVRQRLGYSELTLVAISYGTRMAQEYMRRHPNRVASALLFGALPSSVHTPQGFARLAEDSMQQLIDNCSKDPACARYGDLEEQLGRLFDGGTKLPAQATVQNPMTGELEQVSLHRGMMASTLRALLYETDFRTLVPRVIHEAAGGHYELLAMMTFQWQRAFYDMLNHGLYYSITCSEDVPFVQLSAEVEEATGTFVGPYRVRNQVAVCENWPRGTVPDDYFEPVAFDGPVLLITGQVDPVTPPALAELVAERFTNYRHLELAGRPHDPSNGWPECQGPIVHRFLEEGLEAIGDTACTAELAPVPFLGPDEPLPFE